MIVRACWLTLCLLFLVFVAANPYLAYAEETFGTEDKKHKAFAELPVKNRDQAILNAMDNLEDSLDLLELDRQQQLPKIDQKLLPKNKPIESIGDDLLIDEGFDDLDIETELLDERELKDQVPQELLKQRMIGKKLPSVKTNTGVGVQGEEEQLINKLDKSDLMDVEAEVELWLDPVEPPPELVEDIDDIKQ